MLREAEDSGGEEEASTRERPAQAQGRTTTAARRTRSPGPAPKRQCARRSGAGRPLVRGCALAAACRGAPGRVVRSVLVVRSGQGRARAPRPEPPRAAGRRAGQRAGRVRGGTAPARTPRGPVSARRAARDRCRPRDVARGGRRPRHATRHRCRPRRATRGGLRYGRWHRRQRCRSRRRHRARCLARRWRRGRGQHRERVDVRVPRARFAHAEVQVRLDGRARARRPDSPHALARRDARAGANGERGEVQVRGVETVGGPDAHGQTRGPGRSDEANLAARRGHNRGAGRRGYVDPSVLPARVRVRPVPVLRDHLALNRPAPRSVSGRGEYEKGSEGE